MKNIVQKIRGNLNKKRVIIAGFSCLIILCGVMIIIFLGDKGKIVFPEQAIELIQEGDKNYPDYPEDKKDKLVIGAGIITGDYNPLTAYANGDIAISSIIYESLIDVGRSGEPVEGLCDSYRIKNSGLTYEFIINKEVYFSDGTLLELNNIKENFLLSYEEYFRDEDIEVRGNKVIFKFTNSDPDHIWLFRLGIQKNGSADFIGTGPYKIEQDRENNTNNVILTKNEHYWGVNNGEEKICFVDSDTYSLPTLFHEGKVDLSSFGFNRTGVEAGNNNSYTDMYTMPGNLAGYLGLNMENESLGDNNVRIGLAYAVNYERILNLHDGYADVNPSPFQYVSWKTPRDLEPYFYDREKAIMYFDKAGYIRDSNGRMTRDGTSVNFKLVVYEGQHAQNIGMLIKEDLMDIGIECQLIQLDDESFDQAVYEERDFDLYYGNWKHGIVEDVDKRFGNKNSGGNPEGWSSDKLVKELESLKNSKTWYEQQKWYHKIAEQYHNEVPQIPLDTPRSFVISGSQIEGLKLSPYVNFFWNLDEIVSGKGV